MLVLERKVGERIMVGDDIRIRIIEVRDYQISIGIEAPDDVLILREELYNKKEESA